MKPFFYSILLLSIVISCKNNGTNSESELKKQAIEIAVKYVMEKFEEPIQSIDNDGIITINERHVNFIIKDTKQINYVINPSKIAFGLIDEDSNKDAIVTISSFTGNYLELPEHLFLINSEGKLILSRVIESYMKIMGIDNMVITAEVPTRSPNSPLRDCSVCKEIVKYKFQTGDLIKID